MTPDSSRSSANLIFCIAAYNAANTLPKCLDSIKPFADRVVVVEGRFKDKPFPTRNSTDDTVAIARRYGCEVTVSGDLPQHVQRDLYLVGKEGDFYFMIDADMILQGSFNKDDVLQSDVNVWGLWLVDVDGRNKVGCFIHRHVGVKPRNNAGQMLIDGFGKLMDATYPSYVLVGKFWLRHIREEGRLR